MATPEATARALLAELRSMANPANVEGQRRFGIAPRTEQLGIGMTPLRAIARRHRRDHDLARALWAMPVHEARHLAAMVEDPAAVTKRQMEAWARDFDSWDITDGCSFGLFDRTPHAAEMAYRFSARTAEFVKRSGFAIMAGLAVHDKQAPDEVFRGFLEPIERESDDDRNFVRKAVNWALRSIGKRNAMLHADALEAAERIRARDTKAARWIAADAIRELNSLKVRARLRRPGTPVS